MLIWFLHFFFNFFFCRNFQVTIVSMMRIMQALFVLKKVIFINIYVQNLKKGEGETEEKEEKKNIP